MAPSELAGKLAPLPFRVGDNLVTPTTSAKVLGVQRSSDLTMDRQISAISRAANFNLYWLGKIRSQLTTEATKILVHSLVISHLDYANSLLAGLPKEKLRPLQSEQDSAARLIHRGVFPLKSPGSDCTGSLSTTGFFLRSCFLSSTVCKELH